MPHVSGAHIFSFVPRRACAFSLSLSLSLSLFLSDGEVRGNSRLLTQDRVPVTVHGRRTICQQSSAMRHLQSCQSFSARAAWPHRCVIHRRGQGEHNLRYSKKTHIPALTHRATMPNITLVVFESSANFAACSLTISFRRRRARRRMPVLTGACDSGHHICVPFCLTRVLFRFEFVLFVCVSKNVCVH